MAAEAAGAATDALALAIMEIDEVQPDEKDLDEDDAEAYSSRQGMLTSLTNGAAVTDGVVPVDKLTTIQKAWRKWWPR